MAYDKKRGFVGKEVLNLEEASALLGVSTKTLMKILREEAVPARKIGREWRFSRNALLGWLAEGNSQEYVRAEQVVREYFDRVAPEYDLSRACCYGDELRDLVLEKIPVKEDMVVADIGSGTGYLTKALARRVQKVVSVDNSQKMLNIAARKIESEGLKNVEFIRGEAQDLPLPDNGFDLVFANLLLHHLSDPAEALQDFYRILRSGGKVIITDVEEHTHDWVKKEKSDLWLGFDRDELNNWLKEAGFDDVKVEKLDCDCFTTGSQGQTARINMLIATGEKA